MGQLITTLLTLNRQSESLLLASLLLNEEERNKVIYKVLTSSQMNQTCLPLFVTLMVLIGHVEEIFEQVEKQTLVTNWNSICNLLLQNLSKAHITNIQLKDACHFFRQLAAAMGPENI